MKVQELFETLREAIELGTDPGAKELFDELKELLEDTKDDYADNRGQDKAMGIGTVRSVSSGIVAFEKGFQDHSYGSTTSWDYVLKLGNNMKGDGGALDIVRRVFKEAKEIASNYQTKKIETFDGGFHAYFNDGSVSCKYEYASAFCWIAIRKNK